MTKLQRTVSLIALVSVACFAAQIAKASLGKDSHIVKTSAKSGEFIKLTSFSGGGCGGTCGSP